jgi:hypothetical protein
MIIPPPALSEPGPSISGLVGSRRPGTILNGLQAHSTVILKAWLPAVKSAAFEYSLREDDSGNLGLGNDSDLPVPCMAREIFRIIALAVQLFRWLVSLGATVKYAVMARPASVAVGPFGCKAHSQKFTNRCGPCRHAVLVPEVINQTQFFRGEHDLKAFAAEILHGPVPW